MLLVGLSRDESIHLHLKLLPDPMGSRDGLKIVLRIPIGIINHHNSCLSKVDAKTPGPSCQQKNTEFVILIESLYRNGPIL